MDDDSRNDLNARDQSEHPLEYASEYHAPVLCNAVVKGLITSRDGLYVDGTLGGGGHSAALLEALRARGRVVGIDRDQDAIIAAQSRLSAEVDAGRFFATRGKFDEMERLLSEMGITQVDGLLLDLGVSSHQLDQADRGFSHRLEGPLDMRMNAEDAEDAASLLNSWSESDITMVLRQFGEQPGAGRIARKIISLRPLESTSDLVNAVRQSVPGHRVGKALARVFQAVRIAVNSELESLEGVLTSSESLLRVGGRIAVISYHSLEDRRVKRFFRSGNFEGLVHRDIYGKKLSPWLELTRRPVFPEDAEIDLNARARSARLRIAERLS